MGSITFYPVQLKSLSSQSHKNTIFNFAGPAIAVLLPPSFQNDFRKHATASFPAAIRFYPQKR